MANWFTFQLHVFLRSFQINLRLSSLHGMRSEIKCAFNVMQVKLLSSCSGRLQLHKVNESNDVYKNMWSCCSKWDDDYGKIREHNKCKTAVIRLHQRTNSHLSHKGGFSLFAAIAVFSPFLRQNGELDFVARLSAGWMLHSGNCSSVNKSKADSDYVSVNEQSTERGRGKGGERKENFKSCLGGKARTLDGELTELMRQKGSRESQPGLCLLCSGHCQMSVSALVAMFL